MMDIKKKNKENFSDSLVTWISDFYTYFTFYFPLFFFYEKGAEVPQVVTIANRSNFKELVTHQPNST